jgi:hypothetical protein
MSSPWRSSRRSKISALSPRRRPPRPPQFADAPAFDLIERAPGLPDKRPPDRREIFFRKNGNRGRNETSAKACAGGVHRARSQREGDSGAQTSKKAKSAGAAANTLISLETAKEKVWNSLEKAWKSLEFPWKSLEILGKAWKNLVFLPYPA